MVIVFFLSYYVPFLHGRCNTRIAGVVSGVCSLLVWLQGLNSGLKNEDLLMKISIMAMMDQKCAKIGRNSQFQ